MQQQEHDVSLSAFDNPGRWTIDNSESRFSPRFISSPARKSILRVATPNRYASPISRDRHYSLAQKRARRVSFAPRNDIRFMDKDDSYDFSAFSEAANLTDEEEPTVFTEAMDTPTALLSRLPPDNMSRQLRLPNRSLLLPGSPSLRRQRSILSPSRSSRGFVEESFREDSVFRRPSLFQQFENSNMNTQAHKKMDIDTLFEDEDEDFEMEVEVEREEEAKREVEGEEDEKAEQLQRQYEEEEEEEQQHHTTFQPMEKQLPRSKSPVGRTSSFDSKTQVDTRTLGGSRTPPLFDDHHKNTPQMYPRSPIPKKDNRPIMLRSQAVADNRSSSPSQAENTSSNTVASRTNDREDFNFMKRLAVYQNYIPSSPSVNSSPIESRSVNPESPQRPSRSPLTSTSSTRPSLATSKNTLPSRSPSRSPTRSSLRTSNVIRTLPKSPLAEPPINRTRFPTSSPELLDRSAKVSLSPRFEHYDEGSPVIDNYDSDNDDMEITDNGITTHMERTQNLQEKHQVFNEGDLPRSMDQIDDEKAAEGVIVNDNLDAHITNTVISNPTPSPSPSPPPPPPPQKHQHQQIDRLSEQGPLEYENELLGDEDAENDITDMMITDNDLSTVIQRAEVPFAAEHDQMQQALDNISYGLHPPSTPRRRLRRSINWDNSITSMTSDLSDFNIGDEPVLHDITMDVTDESPYRTPPLDYQPSPILSPPLQNTFHSSPAQQQHPQRENPIQYTPLPPAPSFNPAQAHITSVSNPSLFSLVKSSPHPDTSSTSLVKNERNNDSGVSIKKVLHLAGVFLPNAEILGEDVLEKYVKIFETLDSNGDVDPDNQTRRETKYLQSTEQIVVSEMMKPAIKIVREAINETKKFIDYSKNVTEQIEDRVRSSATPPPWIERYNKAPVEEKLTLNESLKRLLENAKQAASKEYEGWLEVVIEGFQKRVKGDECRLTELQSAFQNTLDKCQQLDPQVKSYTHYLSLEYGKALEVKKKLDAIDVVLLTDLAKQKQQQTRNLEYLGKEDEEYTHKDRKCLKALERLKMEAESLKTVIEENRKIIAENTYITANDVKKKAQEYVVTTRIYDFEHTKKTESERVFTLLGDLQVRIDLKKKNEEGYSIEDMVQIDLMPRKTEQLGDFTQFVAALGLILEEGEGQKNVEEVLQDVTYFWNRVKAVQEDLKELNFHYHTDPIKTAKTVEEQGIVLCIRVNNYEYLISFDVSFEITVKSFIKYPPQLDVDTLDVRVIMKGKLDKNEIKELVKEHLIANGTLDLQDNLQAVLNLCKDETYKRLSSLQQT